MTTTSASFHIEKCFNPSKSLSHNTREYTPRYVIKGEFHRDNIHLTFTNNDKIIERFNYLKANASPQAKKTKTYSPFYEGILNLPDTADRDTYEKYCLDFKNEYEKITNQKILRIDIHLDEGKVSEGKVAYNSHAHILIDRTNQENNKVIEVGKDQMRKVQDAAANSTKLSRGVDSERSKRKHISHQAWRAVKAKKPDIVITQEMIDDVVKIQAKKDLEELAIKKKKYEKELQEKKEADLEAYNKEKKIYWDAYYDEIYANDKYLDEYEEKIKDKALKVDVHYEIWREKLKKENKEAHDIHKNNLKALILTEEQKQAEIQRQKNLFKIETFDKNKSLLAKFLKLWQKINNRLSSPNPSNNVTLNELSETFNSFVKEYIPQSTIDSLKEIETLKAQQTTKKSNNLGQSM